MAEIDLVHHILKFINMHDGKPSYPIIMSFEF